MKIHVFVRHTSHSHGKFRPEWYSDEDCFKNLLNTIDNHAELTICFDGDHTNHFVTKYNQKIVNIDGGCDSKSFTKLLDYVTSLDIPDDDIVYLLEDDYLHREGWCDVLKEIFESSNVDYVSLYDHMDKYFPGYFNVHAQKFVTQLLCTKTCHWRTTPSTTNSYAMKFSTLKRDINIHYKWCDFDKVGKVTQDHSKFCELWNGGKTLVTPIPGYSTHVENQLMSPTIDWVKIIEQTTKKNE